MPRARSFNALDDPRPTAGQILPEIRALLLAEEDPARAREIIQALESVASIEFRFIGPDGDGDATQFFMNQFGRHRTPPRRTPPGEQLERLLESLATTDPGARPRPEMGGRVPGIIRLEFEGSAGYLEIRDSTGIRDEFSRIVGIGFLIAALITLGASAGIGALVSRGLTRPVIALTAATNQMADGDLDARAASTTDDEIGVLAERFNAMASRLTDTITELRRERDTLRDFLADASHELRTPLTAMSTFAELMEREDPNDKTLREIRSQLGRMGGTVDSLLRLSRLDSGVTELAREPIAVSELLNEAWSAAVTRAGSSGAPPDSPHLNVARAGSSAGVLGDHDQLIVLFENLFSNSLQAMGSEGAVGVSVIGNPEQRSVQIVVTDDGPGISADDLPNVFTRFYRGSPRRGEGTGLGLAICKSIVEAHGGKITAASPPHGGETGTEIIVTLPAAEPE